jgi:hypothetical protein
MSTARKSDRYLANNCLATRKERFQSGAAEDRKLHIRPIFH